MHTRRQSGDELIESLQCVRNMTTSDTAWIKTRRLESPASSQDLTELALMMMCQGHRLA